MVKTYRPLVFAVFIVSCLSLVLTLTALFTNNWMQANLKRSNLKGLATLNYGLFKGEHVKEIIAKTTYSIKITCLMQHNVCMMSCYDTGEQRQKELTAFYNQQEPPPDTCTNQFSIGNKNANYSLASAKEVANTGQFLNAGLWTVTLIFLVFGLIAAVVSAFLAVINTAGNPVVVACGVPGMLACNILGLAAHALALSIWAAHHHEFIKINVAIRDTIIGDMENDGPATLGFSYWLMIPAGFLHAVNIGLIYLRQHLINRQPSPVNIAIEEKTDGVIFLY